MSAEPQPAEPARVALTNVRVFDGHQLTESSTVVIDGDRIGTDPAGARIVDAAGAALLPGFIDAHVHLYDKYTLERLRASGVTTALDMGTWPADLVNSLRGVPGLTDIRSAHTAAIAADSQHTKMPGSPEDRIVTGPADAQRFVGTRLADGADYIKIITESPGSGGLDQPTVDALVAATHAHGELVIAHAVAADAVAMAQHSGVDIITHAPLDRPLDETAVSRMVTDQRVAVPTLTMMEGVSHNAARTDGDYRHARDSVTAMHRAGVPILAGTDANSSPGAPANVEHGTSLHHELELLVEAGLSTLDALRAATALPAEHFRLTDRGSIRPGNRADLVLIDGDPLADITATRRIHQVWCAGTEYSLE